MELIEGLKYLGTKTPNHELFLDLLKQIVEKDKRKDVLMREKEVLDMMCVFYKTQNFALKRIYKKTKENYTYNVKLSNNIKEINMQTTRMSFLLDQIEFEKIQKYDEIPYEEFNARREQRIASYEEMAEEMEPRKIVSKLREAQKNQKALLEYFEYVQNLKLQHQKTQNEKIDNLLRERNELIVSVVTKAMKWMLPEKLKNPTSDDNNVEILSNIVITAAKEKPAQKPLDTTFKVPPSKSMIINIPDIEISEKFDFEKLKPKRAQNSFNKKPILRKLDALQTKNLTKHVTIISPSISTSSTHNSEWCQITTKNESTEMNTAHTATATAHAATILQTANILNEPPQKSDEKSKEEIYESKTSKENNDESNAIYSAESLLATNPVAESLPLTSKIPSFNAVHSGVTGGGETAFLRASRWSSDTDDSVSTENPTPTKVKKPANDDVAILPKSLIGGFSNFFSNNDSIQAEGTHAVYDNFFDDDFNNATSNVHHSKRSNDDFL